MISAMEFRMLFCFLLTCSDRMLLRTLGNAEDFDQRIQRWTCYHFNLRNEEVINALMCHATQIQSHLLSCSSRFSDAFLSNVFLFRQPQSSKT